jgi:hypothetical protein
MKTTHSTHGEDINVQDAAEVLHWAEELGVSELELREAIRNVGPNADDVKRALADHQMEQADNGEAAPAEDGAILRQREVAPKPQQHL